MLVGSVFFAFMALLAESLKEQYSYPWISAMRSGVATILAISLAYAGRAKLVFLRPVSLWVRSFSGWASMICGFYALTHYDVEIVLVLTNMYPIWVAVLSWPMLGKLPSARTWVALIVSCVGMALVYTSSISATTELQQFHDPITAIPMAIVAGMLSGVALINLHRIRDIDARSIVTHFSAVATVMSLAVWMVIPLEAPTMAPDNSSYLRLFGVGFVATIGQLCLTKAFSTGVPARVSVVGLSQVAVAAIVKWFQEQSLPTIGSVIGMGLVLASTIWVMVSDDTPDKEPNSQSDESRLNT